MSKNEEKCGSVCSDSLFGVRNLTSNLGAFWTGFWEGLGSVLAGFWLHVGVESCLKGVLKASAFSKCVSKPKNAEKSRFLEARRSDAEAGVGRGSPSWGRVKVTTVYWSYFWAGVGQASGWSSPCRATPSKYAGVVQPAQSARLPRRISLAHASCRRPLRAGGCLLVSVTALGERWIHMSL